MHELVVASGHDIVVSSRVVPSLWFSAFFIIFYNPTIFFIVYDWRNPSTSTVVWSDWIVFFASFYIHPPSLDKIYCKSISSSHVLSWDSISQVLDTSSSSMFVSIGVFYSISISLHDGGSSCDTNSIGILSLDSSLVSVGGGDFVTFIFFMLMTFYMGSTQWSTSHVAQ